MQIEAMRQDETKEPSLVDVLSRLPRRLWTRVVRHDQREEGNKGKAQR